MIRATHIRTRCTSGPDGTFTKEVQYIHIDASIHRWHRGLDEGDGGNDGTDGMGPVHYQTQTFQAPVLAMVIKEWSLLTATCVVIVIGSIGMAAGLLSWV